MTSLGEKRPREDDSRDEASRPRKRPGGASRVSKSEAHLVEQRQRQRAEEARAAAQSRGVEEVVRQHYNAVPERGREWRKTDSRIKGLRSFNNWIKSTVIHKFSPSDPGAEPHPLRVLDVGCGKGGDLQKWQQAPQSVEVYVGIDPAEVSIDQARERYRQMRTRNRKGPRGGRNGYQDGPSLFDAQFLVEDAFSYSLGDLPIIRDIGFGPGSRWGPSGGFDVVSMMFCMHYAFENEAKAKGMLANVAGSLRKGGRFFGVIPNSDVIRDKVTEFHDQQAKQKEKRSENKRKSELESSNDSDDISTNKRRKHETDIDKQEPSAISGSHEAKKEGNQGEGSASSHPKSTQDGKNSLGSREGQSEADESKDSTNNEVEAEKSKKTSQVVVQPQATNAEWGNSIYTVRFPGETPKDGIFRPPFGWKYSYFLEEAVEEVPEYVVPFEAFRAIAEDYNLELQYRKSFSEIWKEEKNSPVFGPLSERMGVRGRDAGPLLVTDEEMEAASFYHAFCFYKV